MPEYIKRTGMTADQFGAGVQVFDAETGQPAHASTSTARSCRPGNDGAGASALEEAVAQQDAVTAQPTAPRSRQPIRHGPHAGRGATYGRRAPTRARQNPMLA